MQFDSLRKRGLLFILAYVLLPWAQADSLLWRIDKPGVGTSYLFGTIHVSDPRVTDVPAPIRQALRQATSFSAEMVMDHNTIQQAASMMVYQDGRRLVDVIGEQRYRQCRDLLLKHHVTEEAIAVTKPWAAAAILSLPIPDNQPALDILLYQQASAMGKKVYGLETPAQQLSLFDNMDIAQQVLLLDNAMNEYDRLQSQIEHLIQLYLQADLQALYAAGVEQLGVRDAKLDHYLHQQMISMRNQRMLKAMLPRLREGRAFIAVGAMHLPGEDGLIQLLKRRDYSVTPVALE